MLRTIRLFEDAQTGIADSETRSDPSNAFAFLRHAGVGGQRCWKVLQEIEPFATAIDIDRLRRRVDDATMVVCENFNCVMSHFAIKGHEYRNDLEDQARRGREKMRSRSERVRGGFGEGVD